MDSNTIPMKDHLDFLGLAQLLNAKMHLSTSVPAAISTKQGGFYFNTTYNNVGINVNGTDIFNTLLYNGSTETFNRLAILDKDKQGYVAAMSNSATSKFVYLSTTGEVLTQRYVNMSWIDPTILTSSVVNDANLIPTSQAVYNSIATINNTIGNYLPLAGGTMGGNIYMGEYAIKLEPINIGGYAFDIYGDPVLTCNDGILFNLYNQGHGTPTILAFSSTEIRTSVNNKLTLGDSSYRFSRIWLEESVRLRSTNNLGATITSSLIMEQTPTLIPGGTPAASYYASLGIYGATINLNSKIVIAEDGNLYPYTGQTIHIGNSSGRFGNIFSTTVNTTNFVLNGSSTITNIVTSIGAVGVDTKIPTEKAVRDAIGGSIPLFSSAVNGIVNGSPAIGPETYVLIGDNSWKPITDINYWTLAGTTLGLNTTLTINDFSFITNTSVALGVRTNYTVYSLYDGGNVFTFLGNIGATPPITGLYDVDILGTTRIETLYLGGSLGVAASITIQASVLSTIPTVFIGTSYLHCGGVSTDGVNVFGFGNSSVGTLSLPDTLIEIYHNGNIYYMEVQTPT